MNYNLDYIDSLAKERLSDFKLNPEQTWTDFSNKYAANTSGYSISSSQKMTVLLKSKPVSLIAFFGAVALLVTYFVRPYTISFPAQDGQETQSSSLQFNELPQKMVYAFVETQNVRQENNTQETSGVDMQEQLLQDAETASDTPKQVIVVRETVYVRDTLTITDTVKIYNSGADSMQYEKRSGDTSPNHPEPEGE